jgi:plastocyanin
VLAVVIVFVAGCGSSHAVPAKSPTALAAPLVKIVANEHGSKPDAFYIPHTIYVKAGQIVTWRNDDEDLHDATANSGAFDSGPMAFRGHFRWFARAPGRYTYFCTLHPEMHGVVVVRAQP